jgi:cell division protein FtsB
MGFTISKSIVPFFLCGTLSFFAYTFLNQKSYNEKAAKILQQKKIELASLKKENHIYQDKIKNLGGVDGKIDKDLLIEYAKEKGYVRKDELVISTK